MDELGFNKLAGAVLATGLGVVALINAPKVFIKDHYPATPAYSVGELEKADAGDAKPLPFPQASWVGAMDAAKGAKVFNKCKSCHNVTDGGANGTGPNLHDIVGKAAGAKASFSYSGALSGAGITWGYEELDAFLTKPSKYLKGTKMSFNGLKKEEQRAAVIEYLRVASNSPIAKPAAAAADAMAPDMKDGAKAAGDVMDASETMIDGKKMDVMTDKAGSMIDGAKDKAGAMVDDQKMDVMKDKADAMVDGEKMDVLKDKAESMVDGAKDKADAMVDGAKDKIIDGAKDQAGDKMDALKDKAIEKTSEKVDGGQ